MTSVIRLTPKEKNRRTQLPRLRAETRNTTARRALIRSGLWEIMSYLNDHCKAQAGEFRERVSLDDLARSTRHWRPITATSHLRQSNTPFRAFGTPRYMLPSRSIDLDGERG